MIKIYEPYHLAYLTPGDTPGIKLAFSTKHGGVSSGHCSTMNMSFNRGDRQDCVEENYSRLAEALGIQQNLIYINHQVHKDAVRVIRQEDCLTGYQPQCEYDAAVTNCSKVTLTATHADCIPVLCYDPMQKAIGAIHSGWKGTVLEIAAKTVAVMQREYHTDPKDLQVWIGPGICKECFLVRQDVYQAFREGLVWADSYCCQVAEDQFTVDMKGIIENSLLRAGVLKTNIRDMQICTACHPGLFFSHRRDQGQSGAMTAVIALEDR